MFLRRRSLVFALAVCLGGAGLFPGLSRAATVSWVAAVSGNWSDGTKWSSGNPPAPGDDVQITVTAATSYTVTLDVNASVNSLVLGASSGTTTQTLLGSGNKLTLSTGTSNQTQIASQGILDLTSSTLVFDSGFYSNGVIVLSGSTLDGTAGLTGPIGPAIWSNGSITLLGQVILKAVEIDNDGSFGEPGGGPPGSQTITGDQNSLFYNDSSGVFTSAPGGGNTVTCSVLFDNDGLVTVQNGTMTLSATGLQVGDGEYVVWQGATLDVSGEQDFNDAVPAVTGPGTLSVEGIVRVYNHSTIQVGTLDLNGGVLGGYLNTTTTSNPGVITVAPGSVMNVTGSGSALIDNTLHNEGTMTIVTSLAQGLNSTLENTGLLTVSGLSIGSSVKVGSGPHSVILGGNSAFINDPAGVVSGPGTLSCNSNSTLLLSGTLKNGLIINSAGGTLMHGGVYLLNGTIFNNSGECLEFGNLYMGTSAAFYNLSHGSFGSLSISGLAEAVAIVNVSPGLPAPAPIFVNSGGMATTFGRLVSVVPAFVTKAVQAGLVPELKYPLVVSTTGALSFEGVPFFQTSTGVLDLGVFQTGPRTYLFDYITSDSPVFLGGTLNVDPRITSWNTVTFQIMSFSSAVGSFAQVNGLEELPNGLFLRYNQYPTSIVLSLVKDSINGQILNSDGTPAVGITVQVATPPSVRKPSDGITGLPQTTTTDQFGYYSFSGIPNGTRGTVTPLSSTVNFNPPSVSGITPASDVDFEVAPRISPISLPDAVILLPYNQQLTQAGGIGTVTYSVTGGSLPGWMTLSPSGLLSGTPPTTTGSPFSFTITATDSNGATGNQVYFLTVEPTWVSSVSVNPTSVTGGNPSTGTVRLNGPAPAGGFVVNLSSSSPGIASVPATVTVGQAFSQATFPITTTLPNATTPVTITASGGGKSPTAILTVYYPTLKSISISPNPITGGNPARGVVTLNSPAQAGGVTVSLECTSLLAAPDGKSVTIPAGSLSTTFGVTTHPDTTATAVKFYGIGDGVEQTTQLTIIPTAAASVTLNPTTVTGSLTSTGTVTLTGPAPAGGVTVTLSSDTPSVATVPASVPIPAGGTTAHFTVQTVNPGSKTTVTITASEGGASPTAKLVVVPIIPVSLTFNPNPVTGGGTTQATVTISAPAPTGGFVVNLITTSFYDSVPSSVTVLAGFNTATFTVTTTVPVSPTTAKVYAEVSAGYTIGILTVNPPPASNR